MSFNIRYGTAPDGEDDWAHRRGRAIQIIRQNDPDLLGVQEALRFQLDDLVRALPQYTFVGAGRDDGRDAGEHSAILFRKDRLEAADGGTFWFSGTPERRGSMSWGNGIPRICTWVRLKDRAAGGEFTVFNVHLDHQSAVSREKSAALLANRINSISGSGAAIVMGDFNAGPDSEPVRTLLRGRPELVDSYRGIDRAVPEVGTFHRFLGVPLSERIDFIFIPRSAELISASICQDKIAERYPSDHFPVTARIVFPS